MAKVTTSPLGKLPLLAFVSESIRELKKVTWPSRQKIVRLSAVVIVASVVTGAYLGALDYLFVSLLGFVLNR